MAKSGHIASSKHTSESNQHAAHNKPAPESPRPAVETGPAAGEGLPMPLMEAMSQTLESVDQSMGGQGGGIGQVSIAPGSRGQYLQAMQRMVGNRAVQRMVQRDNLDGGVPSGPTDAGSTVAGVAADPTPQDLLDFRAAGPYPAADNGTTIIPRTGLGGFNARYDPASQALNITLNIGFNFINGMNITGNTFTAAENSMVNSAIRLNRMLSRLRGPQRQTALDQVREQWQWTGAADPRITTWMAAYKANVENVWSGASTGHVFQGSRPGWESQLANVNVVVNTANITSLAAGVPIPGPQPVHCQSSIYKTPDANLFGAFVTGGAADSGTDQSLSLGSGQIVAQSHILEQQVTFGNNSSVLDSDAQAHLRRIIISFQAPGGGTGSTIDIIGRASTTGQTSEAGRQRNTTLATERAQAVDTFLRTTTVEGRTLANATTRIQSVTSTGAEGESETANSRRADINFGGGQGQNIAAHEFGHMLGLGDEYASTPQKDASGAVVNDASGNPVTRGVVSGTGGDVGDATTHDQLARDMGMSSGAVFENNDNIMSLGSTVRPQHYATFMQALRAVTSINDWKLRR